MTSLLCNINGVIVPCELSASNVQNLPGPLSVAGLTNAQGGLQVGGNVNNTGYALWVNGSEVTTGNSIVAGLTNAQGGLQIGGNVNNTGYALWVDGSEVITGNSVVWGEVTAASMTVSGPFNTQSLGVFQGAIIDGNSAFGQNLGIGADLLVGGLTNAQGGLEIEGNVNNTGYALWVNGKAEVAGGTQIDGNLIVNGLNSVFRQGLVVNAASGLLVALETNGDLEVFGDAFANSWQINSDRRLKSDIEDFKPHGIASVQKLHPVSYHFGAGGVRPRHYGLLADEVEKVVPEAVSERKGVKALDPMALIDVLIIANRELAERVEALEKRLPAAH